MLFLKILKKLLFFFYNIANRDCSCTLIAMREDPGKMYAMKIYVCHKSDGMFEPCALLGGTTKIL